MSYRVGPGCDGCGMCARACPRGAIRLSGDPEVPYEVVSLNCNDCASCVVVCRSNAISIDPDWAQCWARGCPLSSTRLTHWSCTEGRVRCTDCGNPLWRDPEAERWVCVRCDRGAKVSCPKARKAGISVTVVVGT